jgi:hypothetical protein
MNKKWFFVLTVFLLLFYANSVYASAIAALNGKWSLYGTDLQGEHVWTGYIVFNQYGKITSGELRNSSANIYKITSGRFTVTASNGKITGSFTDSDGITTNIMANLLGDQIVGVMKAANGAEEGIFHLVRNIPVPVN